MPKKSDRRDLAILGALIKAIELFREIRPSMPLQYVHAFFLVALEPGLSVSEYAKRSGVSLSVMSRHLLDIGDRNRHMKEGFGLVTSRPNPLELRKNEIYLTPKGDKIFQRIVRYAEVSA